VKNILPELRAQHGWTQAELAQRLGVSRQSIIAIETGRYDPSLPLAFEIAEIFKQPLESIFQRDKGRKK
jgi:putative transcriptional regulator